jgi:starvation-inducible DNA-binding protein
VIRPIIAKGAKALTSHRDHIEEANMTNQIESVTDALNLVLANSLALYLKTKNFHWHVSGPHFRDYHQLLDEQASQILAATDLIAERVRKVGGSTIRSIGHVARLSQIADNDADAVAAADMLAELRTDNLTLIAALRLAKRLADEAGDNASSGLIDNWTDEAEQRAWFLDAAAA